jgi:hypothetical protein
MGNFLENSVKILKLFVILYYSAGIVRFELQYKVYGPDLKNQQYFLPTNNVLSQSEI